MKRNPNLDSPNEQPIPARDNCPGCDLPRSTWPQGGCVRGSREYCCEDCAEGRRCSCADAHLGAISA